MPACMSRAADEPRCYRARGLLLYRYQQELLYRYLYHQRRYYTVGAPISYRTMYNVHVPVHCMHEHVLLWITPTRVLYAVCDAIAMKCDGTVEVGSYS